MAKKFKVERKRNNGKRWVPVHESDQEVEAKDFAESSRKTFGHQAKYRVRPLRLTPKTPKLR